MKKLVAYLLVLGGVVMFVSGCKEEAPAKDAAADQPEAAQPAAPKDHPAH